MGAHLGGREPCVQEHRDLLPPQLGGCDVLPLGVLKHPLLGPLRQELDLRSHVDGVGARVGAHVRVLVTNATHLCVLWTLIYFFYCAHIHTTFSSENRKLLPSL